jgi:phage-related protein
MHDEDPLVPFPLSCTFHQQERAAVKQVSSLHHWLNTGQSILLKLTM